MSKKNEEGRQEAGAARRVAESADAAQSQPSDTPRKADPRRNLHDGHVRGVGISPEEVGWIN